MSKHVKALEATLASHERTGRRIGFAGCGLMLAGLFLPFAHIFFRDELGLSVWVAPWLFLVLGAAALLLAYRKYAPVAICGLLALYWLWSYSIGFAKSRAFAQITSAVASVAAGGTGRVAAAQSASNHIYLNYGFWIAVLASIMILGSAMTPKPLNSKR